MRCVARGGLENADGETNGIGAAVPRRADQKTVFNGPWSALQTHLQGVDGATLAMVPEKCVHCAALLSR
jgi:hypothetical protein